MSMFVDRFSVRNLDRIVGNNPLEFNGLRIEPRTLVFDNVFEGITYRSKIVLQNISASPLVLRTHFPDTCTFKLEEELKGVKLCSGLHINLWVKYTHVHSGTLSSVLIIFVNEKQVKYHINVSPPEQVMYSEPRLINFGKINLGHSLHAESLLIYNKSYKMARFEFDLSNNNLLGLSIKPMRGYVEPSSVVEVEVSLIGFEEGQFYKDIWVKCPYPFRFSVSVDIIKPRLFICHPIEHTDSFMPIMFPPLYGNCKCKQSVTIYNYNMLETNYVIVPELNFNVMAIHLAQEADPSYKSFNFSFMEGHLQASEKKKINIIFQPKQLHSNTDKNFFVCYRIIRLEIINVSTIMFFKTKRVRERLPMKILAVSYSDNDNEFPSTSFHDLALDQDIGPSESLISTLQASEPEIETTEYIRLCLYAPVKPVEVEASPNGFELGTIKMNERFKQSLKLYNKSTSLPIFFEYVKSAYIEIIPRDGKIGISSSVEVTISLTPKNFGYMNSSIRFSLKYYSYSTEKKRELVEVGSITLPFKYNVSNVEKPKQIAKFNMGITPRITNEVGILADDVRFNTNIPKPRAAMLDVYNTIPSRKFDSSKIAFPNDRPTALQPWRDKKVTCKTIFAGVPRVIAPADNYSLTEEELRKKHQNIQLYDQYFCNKKARCPKEMDDVLLPPDYNINETKLLHKFKQIECPSYLKGIKRNVHHGFTSLTPIQTYFVSVSPIKLVLGKIAVDSKYKFNIEVKNENYFPIQIEVKAMYVEKCIFPGLPRVVIANGNTTLGIEETFAPNVVGNFSTIINASINNKHLLPIIFQADVVKAYVTLDISELVFDNTTSSHSQQIKLINTLNIPIHFKWVLQPHTCFTIQPMIGNIIENTFLMCNVTYKPDSMKRNNVRMLCTCKGGVSVLLNVSAFSLKTNVEMLEHVLYLNTIAINRKTVVTNALRNNGYNSVSFMVRNSKPFPGIEITPTSGTVKGRSDFYLQITAFYDYFVKFDCKVEIELDQGSVVYFVIFGNVEFPFIVFSPNEISLKRVPAESFDIATFSITNKGESDVFISFEKTLFPEIKVYESSDCAVTESCKDFEGIINAGQTITLYIHFFPLDVILNEFYLPVVINNFLGPPFKGDNDSLKPPTYTEKNIPPEIETEYGAVTNTYPDYKLPILTINSSSSRHILRFNKTYFKFKYSKFVAFKSKTTDEFRIVNSCRKVVEFSLNIQGIYPSFEIYANMTERLTFENHNYMAFSLRPDEEVSFTITYIPIDHHKVIRSIPIFLKNIKSGTVFTFVKLKGSVLDTHMTVAKCIHLEPVAVGVLVTKEFILTISNHPSDCVLSVKCDDEELVITLPDDYPSRFNKSGFCFNRDLTIKVQFWSHNAVVLVSKVVFSCTCGAEAHTVITACADENVVTIYMTQSFSSTLQSHPIKSKVFPLFPDDAEKGEFANFMRNMLKITERWLFEQVFHMTYYYFIPESMTKLYRYNARGKTKPSAITIVKIFQNICGHDILQYLVARQIPTESESERINYMHATMKNVVNLLLDKGAYFPHVKARYLLDYDDYTKYVTKVREEKQKPALIPDDRAYFYRRAKQCWLDVILQTFKTMILTQITFRKRRLSRMYDGDEINEHNSYNCDSQQALLTWLTTIYENQKKHIMKLVKFKPPNFVLHSRQVNNFTTDLSDGLVLTAVTINYCPYLKPYLEYIHIKVDTPEKAFHNAILLTQAWSLIHCSFRLLPEEIANPVAIQMLMFITYLFNVFPQLLPRDNIEFSVSLSYEDYKYILLRNPNTIEIFYVIVFINNNLNCFGTQPKNTIMVPPGKQVKLKIKYFAKKMGDQEATLVLCGDFPGEAYCKSLVYSLTGQTTYAKDYDCKIIQVNLYGMKEKEIQIQSPYKTSATYSIHYFRNTFTESKFQPKMKNWKEEIKSVKPRTIYCKEVELICDDMGVGTLHIIICSLSVNKVEGSVFFVNKDVGDFFISVVLEPINFQLEKYLLKSTLPANWDELVCICTSNKYIQQEKCPRRIPINIPCKNDHFWNIVSKSILLGVKESEKQVWKEYLASEMGPYILKWLFIDDSTVQHVFNTNLTYDIFNTNKNIDFPEKLTIPNIRSHGTVQIYIHINNNLTSSTKRIEFAMQSEDKAEYRLYRVEFSLADK